VDIKQLSTTLISGWGGEEGCPRRAWRSYQRRLWLGDDNEGTDPTRFGTVVHGTMEEYHSFLLENPEAAKHDGPEVMEFVMELFDNQWRTGTCYNFDIYQFGRTKIYDFLKRSIFNRLGETISTELMFVLDLDTMQVFLPATYEEALKIIERILAIGNIPVLSKIDRIDRVKPGHYEVYDYKTNILPFTRDQIEHSTQLGIYDMVVRAIYPDATQVTCIFDMLRHGRFPVEFDDAFRQDLRRYLINLWWQIDAAEKPEERINKYCRWCEIRSDCAAYRASLDSTMPAVLTESFDTQEGLQTWQHEYERLGDLIKIASERQKEIKEALGAKIVKDGLGEPYQVGDMEMYLQPNPRYEYDKKEVLRILTEQRSTVLIPDLMGTVSKAAVERVGRNHPQLKELLDAHVTKKMAVPSLKFRRLKGGKSQNTEEASDE
jgi:hypothetical protein